MTAQVNPHATPADIAQGKRLYLGHCAGCHGPAGEGARGAILARPKLPRAPDDAALFDVIRRGIPGTEMPTGYSMTEHEVWQVVAFIRTLGRTDVSAVIPGNAARGAELFAAKGCVHCHTVNMRGGRMGPALTDIGERRSPAYLHALLLNPENYLPDGFMLVRVATKDGKRLTGILINEDSFSVQIRDLSDQLHSFWKDELSEFEKQPGKTPMPS